MYSLNEDYEEFDDDDTSEDSDDWDEPEEFVPEIMICSMPGTRSISDVSLPMRCMIWERKGSAAQSVSMYRRTIKEFVQVSGLESMAFHAVRREKKQLSGHMHLCGITDCG